MVIFILAADEERTSPLESEVAHIAAYLGHAYELRWDQPLNTLGELLHVVGRLHRAVDIALDLCTQILPRVSLAMLNEHLKPAIVTVAAALNHRRSVFPLCRLK